MDNKNNKAGIKKEFAKLAIEITLELVAMGMTETEIHEFWKECVQTATKVKMPYKSISNN